MRPAYRTCSTFLGAVPLFRSCPTNCGTVPLCVGLLGYCQILYVCHKSLTMIVWHLKHSVKNCFALSETIQFCNLLFHFNFWRYSFLNSPAYKTSFQTTPLRNAGMRVKSCYAPSQHLTSPSSGIIWNKWVPCLYGQESTSMVNIREAYWAVCRKNNNIYVKSVSCRN